MREIMKSWCERLQGALQRGCAVCGRALRQFSTWSKAKVRSDTAQRADQTQRKGPIRYMGRYFSSLLFYHPVNIEEVRSRGVGRHGGEAKNARTWSCWSCVVPGTHRASTRCRIVLLFLRTDVPPVMVNRLTAARSPAVSL